MSSSAPAVAGERPTLLAAPVALRLRAKSTIQEDEWNGLLSANWQSGTLTTCPMLVLDPTVRTGGQMPDPDATMSLREIERERRAALDLAGTRLDEVLARVRSLDEMLRKQQRSLEADELDELLGYVELAVDALEDLRA
jgi:hypothetical protein